MSDDHNLPDKKAERAGVDTFLRQVARTPVASAAGRGARGRLLFAMDATASRQPSWDRAARIQGEMFAATAAHGGLDVQLAFYRGFGEFKVSKWTDNADDLLRLMTSVTCRAGETQVVKVLQHARNETKAGRIGALVFVGDCFEEDVDAAGKVAGEMGLLGLPAFMFHEGDDPLAAFAFQQIAQLSGGAYCSFDAASAEVLMELLRAVAVYAAGGRPALENLAKSGGRDVRMLTDQMTRNRGR